MTQKLTAGDDLGQFEVVFAQELIDQYAVVSGDNNPVHLDADFAATSVFGGRVAHGMLGSNLIQRFLADRFGAHSVSSLQFKFRYPIKSGETATFRASVESVSADFAQVKVDCLVPSGEVAIVCSATIRCSD